MSIKTFNLVHDEARKNAIRAVTHGYAVEVGEMTRTKKQNAFYHALIGKIRKHVLYGGEKRSVRYWKAIFADAWEKETDHKPEIARAFDGTIINLRCSTSELIKSHFSELIEVTFKKMSEEFDIEVRQIVDKNGNPIDFMLIDSDGVVICRKDERINH